MSYETVRHLGIWMEWPDRAML